MQTALRVLILDDRPSDTELMLYQLKQSGFAPQWTCVDTEADYLAQLAHGWDVILSDYQMSQFTAKQALHLLQERELDIPFIVVTGTVGEDVAVAMMREGAADYLLKDRLARLGEAVRIAVEQHQMRQRKREAEQALAQEHLMSERRAAELEAVLDAVPAAVFIAHDPLSRRISGNRMAYELLGMLPRTNISMSASLEEKPTNYKVLKQGQETPPEELPVQQAAQGHERRNWEGTILFADGTIRTIYGNAMPLWDEQGQPRGAIGAFIDITDRKRAEAALRENEERLRQTIESIPALIWTARPDGWVDYFNHRWLDYTGQSPEAVLGWKWMNFLHPDDLATTKREWERAVAEGHAYEVEQRLRGPDGNYNWFLVRGTPLRDAQGRIMKWYGTNFEIADRKRAEEVMQTAMLAAEQANKAKDQFLAVLSHELRTPLTPVLAAVDLLQRILITDEESRQCLAMIHRNVELEARMIDDLLDINRIAHGKVELNKQPVDVYQVIQGAVEVCKANITMRRLHFGVELGGGSYWVEADTVRLQQVFWNLLQNAIKFTPPGGRVDIRCHGENGQVVIEVKDSGVGIEPELLKRLFTIFEQGEKALGRQFGGLGLGLAISKSLVQLHGGTIDADSEGKDKGAIFRVRLPLISTPAAMPTPPSTPEAFSSSSKRILRILLVEDNGDTARMLKQLLVRNGHEVHIASDIASGMALAERSQFDLLLSDLGLPDGSGYDLMRALRSQGRTLPGIAISGYGQEQDIAQSHEAGFAEHLTKPVTIDLLLAAIQRVTSGADR